MLVILHDSFSNRKSKELSRGSFKLNLSYLNICLIWILILVTTNGLASAAGRRRTSKKISDGHNTICKTRFGTGITDRTNNNNIKRGCSTSFSSTITSETSGGQPRKPSPPGTGTILIYGGSGIFGSFLVNFFQDQQYFVTNVDFKTNENADLNILLQHNLTFEQQAFIVANAIPEKLKYNAIICTTSGLSAGNLKSHSFMKSVQEMLEENLWSSFIASSLAPNYLRENGFLILMGGKDALKPMPTMIAYSVAKAAVHQLVRSIGMEGSGLPRGAKAYAILPAFVNSNQKKNRGNSQGKYTVHENPLLDLARMLFSWINNQDFLPSSGSLIQFLMSSEDKTNVVISN